MLCYDCTPDRQTSSRAVATCHGCGAATCAEHTYESGVDLRTSTMGNPVTSRARRLTCGTCATGGVRGTGRPGADALHG